MPPFTGRSRRPASTAAHGWLEPVRGVVQNPKTPRTRFQPLRGVSQNPKTPKGGFRKPVRGVAQNSKTPKGGFRKPQTPPGPFFGFSLERFSKLRVLVCGSKSYKDIDSICHMLNAAYLSWQASRNEWRSHSDDMPTSQYWDEFVLIEGGAPGADEIAARWWAPQLERDDQAKRLHIQVPADWGAPCDPTFCGKRPRHRRPREHGPGSYCPAAEARRNQKMLDEY